MRRALFAAAWVAATVLSINALLGEHSEQSAGELTAATVTLDAPVSHFQPFGGPLPLFPVSTVIPAHERLTASISAYLAGSPLEGEAKWLVDYSAEVGVYAVLVAGIATWESGLGRQAVGWNLCGLRNGPGSYAVYESAHEGLKACAENLASPMYRGLSVDDTLALWLTGSKDNRSEDWALPYIARVKGTMEGMVP